MLVVTLATNLAPLAQGQTTDANNSVCVKADWKVTSRATYPQDAEIYFPPQYHCQRSQTAKSSPENFARWGPEKGPAGLFKMV